MRLLGQFLAMRTGERRDAWASFFTLFGVIGSLSILETARDALFLTRLPASQLPWMYIALAIISLALANLQSRFARPAGRASLAVWTLGTAIVTLALAELLHTLGTAGVYVIYVWTGLSTTLVVVRLWTLLAARFTVTQARRLYGFIGAGSVIGAIVGSAVARTFATWMGPRHLVLIAGFGFAATSLLPLVFTRDTRKIADEDHDSMEALKGSVTYLARQSYARRLVLAMFVATACVTLGDFLFKSAAAEHVPKAELARWLATVYLVLNVGSLFAQVVLTGFLTRRLPVPTAFAILPVLFLAGSIGMIATAGIVAALAIKAADGTLRYSLHKTTSELLFLPFGDAARTRVKAFIDVVGQRGGQALGSIVILAIGVWGESTRVTAIAFGVLALAWIALAGSLRDGYVGLFRGRLSGPRLKHLEAFPEIDVASLETLIASLDSNRDDVVLASLDALEREDKVRLIPVLTLYHPSEAVVERALAIFARSHRTNAVPAIDRILDSPSPRIRAAALAARSVLDSDAQPLLLRASVDDSPEVRTTITVNLIASGEISGSDARERTAAVLHHGTSQTKIALAEAVARRRAVGFADTLIELARDADRAVRRAVAGAMNDMHDPVFIPTAIDFLHDEQTRRFAKQILVGLELVALDAVTAALGESTRSPARRWRIAQLIPAFEPRAATRALSALLPREDDGAVRFQIIRGLEAIARRHPDVAIDRAVLDDAIGATLRRAYRYVERHATLVRGARDVPARATPGHALLARVLEDKSRNAVDRLFRLLGLAYPTEELMRIYREIVGGDGDARASGMEIVANVLPASLRGAVIGLVDDASDGDRVAAAGPYRQAVANEYTALLGELLESTSESVRSVTVFHIGELALTEFAPRIEKLSHLEIAAGSDDESDAARVLERLVPRALDEAAP